MSAISVSAVNETAMNQTTNATAFLHNTTRQEVMHALDDLDVIKNKDLFLDGCKVSVLLH